MSIAKTVMMPPTTPPLTRRHHHHHHHHLQKILYWGLRTEFDLVSTWRHFYLLFSLFLLFTGRQNIGKIYSSTKSIHFHKLYSFYSLLNNFIMARKPMRIKHLTNKNITHCYMATSSTTSSPTSITSSFSSSISASI